MNNNVIFLSSTFKDMHAERDVIHNSVLPELTNRFEGTAVTFDFVDLRWGIDTEDEQGEQQASEKILQVCFDEIERSDPFFICFLGERYGWTPRTENIRGACLNAGLSPEQYHGKSITEMEIEFALTQFRDRENCYFFFREGLNETDIKNPETRSVYFATDAAEKEKVALLKNRLREAFPHRVFSYSCRWDDRRETVTGLEALGEFITEQIRQTVTARSSDEAVDTRDPYVKERLIQENFFTATAAATIDRPRYTAPILAFAEETTAVRELALIAPSGLGKSSLMALIADRLAREGTYVLKLSAGLTAGSLDFPFAVRYLYACLCRDFHYDFQDGDYTAVKQNFFALLSTLSEDRKIAIVIDALNQFNDSEELRKLDWINELFIPENVRILYSCLPGQFDRIFQKREVRCISLETLESDEIASIAQASARKFHKQLSATVLSALVEKREESGHVACRQPLYLAMLMEYISDFDIDDYRQIAKLEQTVSGAQAISQYIHSKILSAPADTGSLFGAISQKCAKHIGAEKNDFITVILAQSRFGLRESDICQVSRGLGLDISPADFSIYRKMFRLHLMQRSDGRWDFSHAALRSKVALDEAANTKRETIRRWTARYLLSLDPEDALRQSELMYYLATCGMYGQIKELFVQAGASVSETEVRELRELLCLEDTVSADNIHAMGFFTHTNSLKEETGCLAACDRLLEITNGLFIMNAKLPHAKMLMEMLRFLLEAEGIDDLHRLIVRAYYSYGAIMERQASKHCALYFDLAVGLSKKKCPDLLPALYRDIFQIHMHGDNPYQALNTANSYVKSAPRWRNCFSGETADALLAGAYYCKAQALAAIPLLKKSWVVQKWYGKAAALAAKDTPLYADIVYAQTQLTGNDIDNRAEFLPEEDCEKAASQYLRQGDRIYTTDREQAKACYARALECLRRELLSAERLSLLSLYQKASEKMAYTLVDNQTQSREASTYFDISQKLCKKLCFITGDHTWNDKRLSLLADYARLFGADENVCRQQKEGVSHTEVVVSSGYAGYRPTFNRIAEQLVLALLGVLFVYFFGIIPLNYMVEKGNFEIATAFLQTNVLTNFTDFMQFFNSILMALAVCQLQMNMANPAKNTVESCYGKKKVVQYTSFYMISLLVTMALEAVKNGLFSMRVSTEAAWVLFTELYYYALNATLVFLLVWVICDSIRFARALWEERDRGYGARSNVRRELLFGHRVQVAVQRLLIMALVPLPLYIGVRSGAEFESLTYSGLKLAFFWKLHWFPFIAEAVFCGICLYRLRGNSKLAINPIDRKICSGVLRKAFVKTMGRSAATVLVLTICVGAFLTLGLGLASHRDLSNYPCENGFYYEAHGQSVTVQGYGGEDSVVQIPAELGGMPVTCIGSNAFSDNARTLREIYLPDGITVIESGAFERCAALETVHFGDRLITVKTRAFANCSSLRAIVLPESVTCLEESAFANCSGAKTLTLSENLAELPKGAFEGCASLEEVVFPASVTTIGDSAFENCPAIKNIVFTENIQSIGNRAFAHCIALEEVELPQSFTSEEGGVFAGCTSLKKVRLPEGMTRLGGATFSGCTSLTELVIPDSVTLIESRAFSDCTSLAELVIPDSVTQIKSYAFSNSGLEKITLGKGLTNIEPCFEGCDSLKTLIIRALDVNGGTAFNNLSVEMLVLEEGVETVSAEAFSGCADLKELYIPQSLKQIGEQAFLGCTGLETVHITSVEAWCEICFECSESWSEEPLSSNPLLYAQTLALKGSCVTDIVLSENVTAVGNYAFYSYSPLKSITFSRSVESIGISSFEGCENLKTVRFSDGIKTVGESAFESCKNLTKVHASSLESWCQIDFGSYGANPAAYYNSSAIYLDTSNIPSHKDFYIGEQLFDGIIDIPSTVSRIGSHAFDGVGHIEEIHIPPSVTYIGSVAYTNVDALYIDDLVSWCKIDMHYADGYNTDDTFVVYVNGHKLSQLVVPEQITAIPDAAFYGWRSVEMVVLHENITSVGKDAFVCGMIPMVCLPEIEIFCKIDFENSNANPCYLATEVYFGDHKVGETLTLPETLGELKAFAFSGFRSTEKILVPTEITKIHEDAFENCEAEVIYGS